MKSCSRRCPEPCCRIPISFEPRPSTSARSRPSRRSWRGRKWRSEFSTRHRPVETRPPSSCQALTANSSSISSPEALPQQRLGGYEVRMRTASLLVSLVALTAVTRPVGGTELQAGQPAPLFTAKTQDGAAFDLASRKGQWTVLYFFPKAGTPGCTKQACAFRDNIALIRDQGADVYGISTDTVESQAAFHKEQQLPFTLLADPDGVVTEKYGAKMPLLTMAKRWTFIIDPTLTIQLVERDVDPA